MKLKLFTLFIFAGSLCFAMTPAEIAQMYGHCIVTVNTATSKGGTFNGTGFIVTSDGLIATNKHVVENAIFINVTFSSGLVSGQAEVISTGQDLDLALIKINAKDLPTVILGDSDYAPAGSEITVIGSPRRLQNTVTNGLLSQSRLMKKNIVWHQISAPISPSSSGSPVFNTKGEVISIVFSTFKGEGNQNLNFSIPSNYLKSMIAEKGYMLPDEIKPPAQQYKGISGFFKRRWNIIKGFFGANS
ncbi:S1-C subfamily serine protease [Elusimicrobium posterum]|uniref:S1C family serine protease n=1 Tax=Elusimicrobium posterum TaxID=3116653 RepID=UPI003C783F18